METVDEKSNKGLEILQKLYDKAGVGISKVVPPISDVADDYLHKSLTREEAAKAFINNQITKCTVSGFVTGFGGLITLPVSMSANITSVLYVQMRMIQGIAYIAGYDLASDQVQTFCYACLAGISVNEGFKKLGLQFGQKLTLNMVKKIPGKTLQKINHIIGFKFLTKFGEKGLVNLGKAVPLIGGPINGGLDFIETKIIADRAYKMFIIGEIQ